MTNIKEPITLSSIQIIKRIPTKGYIMFYCQINTIHTPEQDQTFHSPCSWGDSRMPFSPEALGLHDMVETINILTELLRN